MIYLKGYFLRQLSRTLNAVVPTQVTYLTAFVVIKSEIPDSKKKQKTNATRVPPPTTITQHTCGHSLRTTHAQSPEENDHSTKLFPLTQIISTLTSPRI